MNFIYFYILVPLLRFGLWMISFSSAKVRQGLLERRHPSWYKNKIQPGSVLIHASSGEFEYAKPLVRALKARGHRVAISYFSPTYAKNIAATPEVDIFGPCPWESPHEIKRFLDQVQPSAYLIARTDVWPGIVAECKRRNIPTALFSATLTESSKRMKNPISRFFAKWSLEKLDHLFCVSASDVAQFARLNLSDKCSVVGDTRFEQVLYRLQNPKPLKTELKPLMPTLVCGSTWEQDERVLMSTLTKFKGQLKTIIAPHEPTPQHLAHLEQELTKHGLTFQRYQTSNRFEHDVLIIDQVGILADLYAWGQIAFVGGSFRKTVHSVMEPLASSCVTLVGPLHGNNREAQEFQSVSLNASGLSAVISVQDSQQMTEAVSRVLNLSAVALAEIRSQIHSEVQKRARATNAILSYLDSRLS